MSTFRAHHLSRTLFRFGSVIREFLSYTASRYVWSYSPIRLWTSSLVNTSCRWDPRSYSGKQNDYVKNIITLVITLVQVKSIGQKATAEPKLLQPPASFRIADLTGAFVWLFVSISMLLMWKAAFVRHAQLCLIRGTTWRYNSTSPSGTQSPLGENTNHRLRQRTLVATL